MQGCTQEENGIVFLRVPPLDRSIYRYANGASHFWQLKNTCEGGAESAGVYEGTTRTAQNFVLGHYKLDHSFPSTARMPFELPPTFSIIALIFY